MSDMKHTVILASAGSGKTFRLAHHFIHLLVHDVPVERILALTFSRKASGEITDSIVKYLYQAATNERHATTIGTRLDHPELTSANFTRILSSLLAHIHRLGTSTLDSFLINILQAFPFELGVPPSVRFMENGSYEAAHLRATTLGRILDPHGLSADDRERFMAAFHHSTGGRADATITLLMEEFIETGLATRDTMPNTKSWGDATRIWSAADLRHIISRPAPDDEAQAWAQELTSILTEQQGMNKTLCKSLIKLANDCALYSAASSTVPNKLDGTGTAGVAEGIFQKPAGTPLQIVYQNKPQTFSLQATELFRKLLTRVLHVELQKSIARTQGLYHVLTAYAAAYATSIKQSGWMTFSDAQNILAGHSESESRLDIDYRLDGRIDHWLLDEFQDTSDPQWKGLSHLIDEVIEDTSLQRTFFMVGDVKQAIHGWRGGNPHLAQAIVDRYGITPQPMGESFRSCVPIIDAVNQCFTNIATSNLPPDAVTRWQKQWTPHTTHITTPGYVCMLETGEREKDDEINDDTPVRYHVVTDILRQLNPVSNGLSVAILTRSNKESARIADHLRQTDLDIPVSLEGVAPFVDNLVAETLLALIGFSLHPADTRLWQFLQMTPLTTYLRDKNLDQNTLPGNVLGLVHHEGYPAFLRHWGGIMDKHNMLDDFGRSVVSRMILAAEEFRATGSSIEAFVPYMQNATWAPSSIPGGVSILTIHRSKGLGFDVVILPQLDTQGHYLNRADLNGILLHREQGHPEQSWRLDIPPRNWAELDSTLRKHIQQQDALSCYDELCVLYVAMTRAKRGLYMIVPPMPEKEGKGLKVSSFLRTQLSGGSRQPKQEETSPFPLRPTGYEGQAVRRLQPDADPCSRVTKARVSEHTECIFEVGSTDWAMASRPVSKSTPLPVAQTIMLTKRESTSPTLELMEPSKTADHATSLSWLFHENHRDVLAFGSAIHELLAQVDWVQSTHVETVIAQWLPKAGCNERVRDDVVERFRQCLTEGPIRSALTKPAGTTELWREKPFELILDHKLVRGVFDRVVIQSERASVRSAVIIDFKSDRIDASEVAERSTLHKGQMDLYRKALAKILGIPESAITCQLLFVVPGIVTAV